MKLIAASDVPPTPWKNGGGVTRELLRVDDEAGHWGLRISVADIDADGPFSAFPGVTRWFAVVAGAGVRLAWPGRAPLDLRRGDPPHRFDGDPGPACQLLDGGTRDLNVMVRQDFGSVDVDLATFGDDARPPRTPAMGFFALTDVRLHGPLDHAVAVPALSLCWRAAPSGPARPWRIEPAARQAASAQAPGLWISLQSQRP